MEIADSHIGETVRGIHIPWSALLRVLILDTHFGQICELDLQNPTNDGPP